MNNARSLPGVIVPVSCSIRDDPYPGNVALGVVTACEVVESRQHGIEFLLRYRIATEGVQHRRIALVEMQMQTYFTPPKQKGVDLKNAKKPGPMSE